MPAVCEVPMWQLTFPDVVKMPGPPEVPTPYPNLTFTLNVSTTYDDDGRLAGVALVTNIID